MGLLERYDAEPVYNTRAVVQRTSVPADTFRAWERRYGVPRPTRTAGNQRLYSDRDIATIAWLRDQTRAGMTISQAVARLRHEDDGRPTADPGSGNWVVPTAQPRPEPGDVPPADRMTGARDTVVEALVAFDAASADRALEESMALLPMEDVCLHILQPALYEIGHRWARGEVDISAEHFASGFVIRKLGALFNLSQPEHGRGPLVGACLEGELHEVGLLLTCLFLSRRGFAIVYLGANLPLDNLLRTIRHIRPPIVLLSASTVESAERLGRDVELLRERCAGPDPARPEPCPVVGFGGNVFVSRPELQRLVAGVFLGRTADEATQTINGAMAMAAVG